MVIMSTEKTFKIIYIYIYIFELYSFLNCLVFVSYSFLFTIESTDMILKTASRHHACKKIVFSTNVNNIFFIEPST